MTSRRRTLLHPIVQVAQINRKLNGWANYFRVGTTGKAYHVVNRHVAYRFRRWLCAKHKVQSSGATRFPDSYLYQDLGLTMLRRAKPAVP